MGEILRNTLLNSPIVKRGEYDYFVHPITDGIPEITPELLSEVVNEIRTVADLNCDKIVTAEAMGIPIGTALSIETGLPLVIIRKKEYKLSGEVSIEQVTGYSKSRMFINGLSKGDRVVFVDDVLSTGGTLKAIVDALREIGVKIVDIVIAIDKGKKSEIEKEIGMMIKTLASVDIVDGKVVVK